MDEKDNLNQEQNSNSTPSNLPIAVKENKFKNLIEDIKDPMFSWRLREGFRDFTDSVSMSAVGQAFRRVVVSVTGAVSNFANKIKENAEAKKYNEQSKNGISVSTIETQEIRNSIIMPQAAQKTAKDAPSTIILAQTQSKGTIIDNAKSAKDVELEAAENGIKLEDMEVDESAVVEDSRENDKSTQAQEPVVNTPPPQIEAGEINFGQPVQSKETKATDDLEK